MRFKVNREKVIEALAWLAQRQPGITPYFVAKVLYFADKEHLNRYGRPVLGDSYVAMEHGPVPSFAYDLIKHDDFLAPELLEQADGAFRVDRRGRYPQLTPIEGREPRLEKFSRTDIVCLERALARYGRMEWRKLWDVAHAERAWAEADENGPMDVNLMIEGEDEEERRRAIAHLEETSLGVAL